MAKKEFTYLLFVHGKHLQDGIKTPRGKAGQNWPIESSKLLGQATLDGYQRVFNSPDVLEGSTLSNIVESEGNNVTGALYGVNLKKGRNLFGALYPGFQEQVKKVSHSQFSSLPDSVLEGEEIRYMRTPEKHQDQQWAYCQPPLKEDVDKMVAYLQEHGASKKEIKDLKSRAKPGDVSGFADTFSVNEVYKGAVDTTQYQIGLPPNLLKEKGLKLGDIVQVEYKGSTVNLQVEKATRALWYTKETEKSVAAVSPESFVTIGKKAIDKLGFSKPVMRKGGGLYREKFEGVTLKKYFIHVKKEEDLLREQIEQLNSKHTKYKKDTGKKIKSLEGQLDELREQTSSEDLPTRDSLIEKITVYERRIAVYEYENSALDTANVALKSQLTSQIDAAGKAYKSLEDKLEKLRDQENPDSKELQEYQKQVTNLKGDLKKAQNFLQKEEAQRSWAEGQATSLREENDRLKGENDAAVATFEKERNEFSKHLQGTRYLLGQENLEKSRLKSELEVAKSGLEGAEAYKKDVNARVASLEGENARLKGQDSVANVTIEHLTKDLEDAQENASNLEQENTRLRGEYDSRVAAFEGERTGLWEHLQGTRYLLGQQTLQTGRLESELEGARTELDLAEDRKASVETQVKSLGEENARLRGGYDLDVAKVNQDNARLESELKETTARAISAEQEVVLNQGRIGEYAVQVEELESELEGARSGSSGFDDYKATAEARIVELEEAAVESGAKYSGLESDLGAGRKLVAEANEKVVGLESELDAARSGSSGFDDYKATAEARIAELEKAGIENESEISGLQDEIGEHKAEYGSIIDSFESDLKGVKAELQEANDFNLGAKETIGKLTADNEEYSTVVSELETEREAIGVEYKALESDFNDLRGQFDGASEAAILAEDRVGELEKENTTLWDKAKTYAGRISSLEEQLENAGQPVGENTNNEPDELDNLFLKGVAKVGSPFVWAGQGAFNGTKKMFGPNIIEGIDHVYDSQDLVLGENFADCIGLSKDYIKELGVSIGDLVEVLNPTTSIKRKLKVKALPRGLYEGERYAANDPEMIILLDQVERSFLGFGGDDGSEVDEAASRHRVGLALWKEVYRGGPISLKEIK